MWGGGSRVLLECFWRKRLSGMSHVMEPSKRMVAPVSSEDMSTDVVLELTDLERRLFDILLSVVQDYKLRTTLRVAGGWVRDKVRKFDLFLWVCNPFFLLLIARPYRDNGRGFTQPQPVSGNVVSHRQILNDVVRDNKAVDIDIALDNLFGYEFAALVNKWLEEHGEEHHDFGVIHKNSEKSKHLETARVKVGLRKSRSRGGGLCAFYFLGLNVKFRNWLLYN